jgi:hypothetical protein
MQQHSEKIVVLMASQPYSATHEPLLIALIERQIELFCAVGTDCENWETAFDLLLTDPARGYTHHITTTSHPDEPLEDVLNMASFWIGEGGSKVEILDV